MGLGRGRSADPDGSSERRANNQGARPSGARWLSLDPRTDSREASTSFPLRPTSIKTCTPRSTPRRGAPEYNEKTTPRADKDVTFCPSLWGGKDWESASYDPKNRLLIIPANDNICGRVVGEKEPLDRRPAVAGSGGRKARPEPADQAELHGRTAGLGSGRQQKVWSYKFPNQLFASAMATGGDLVFVGGTNDRNFRAFNAKNGELLWQFKTNSGIRAGRLRTRSTARSTSLSSRAGAWMLSACKMPCRSSASASPRMCRKAASCGSSR